MQRAEPIASITYFARFLSAYKRTRLDGEADTWLASYIIYRGML